MASSTSLFSNPDEVAPRPAAVTNPTPTNDPFLAPPERPEEEVPESDVEVPAPQSNRQQPASRR